MIYNFNKGIGWASSGVEYAQSYRGKIFRKLGVEAKFIFTDMKNDENIEHLTKNLGFEDNEIIWLYNYFTDVKIAPTTYTLNELLNTIPDKKYDYTRKDKKGVITFEGKGNYFNVIFTDEQSENVFVVEIVSNGRLIRKDYYSYVKIFSEFFAPLDHKAHLYLRTFYNENGSVAYQEITDDKVTLYQFDDKFLYSKEEFIGYMVSKLNLTKNDIVIIDRTTDVGQAILENTKDAKVGIVIHADHFNESCTNDNTILWNNYYEYSFAMNKHIDFYITSTDEQTELLKKQFIKYKGVMPKVHTIPVGSINELKKPKQNRKAYSIITASRLAPEKHIDLIIRAVIKAKKRLPMLSLDIYGKGKLSAELNDIISKNKAEDYIKLMGHKNLYDIYKNYELYLSGSKGEGFGLTLLEAIGSGLPIIGFNVRYGNPTFVDNEKNGYLIDVVDGMTEVEKVNKLSECIIKYFTEANIEDFHKHSYKKAEKFLEIEIEKKWKEVIDD